MRSTLELEIAEPCHENWQQMKASQQGRFCGSCQKTVVDFSHMSDKQLLAYFKNYKGGVCGRFDDRQLLRPLIAPPPPKPGWIKWAIASLITFLSFSSKTKAQENTSLNGFVGVKDSKEKVQQSQKLKDLEVYEMNGNRLALKAQDDVLWMGKVGFKDPTEITCTTKKGEVASFEAKLNQIEIKGTVRDESGVTIPFASVTVAGSKWGTAADSLGNYSLQIPMQQSEFTLAASAVGYQPKIRNLSIVDINKDQFDFILALDTSLDEVIVMGNTRSYSKGMVGSVTAIKVVKERELSDHHSQTKQGTIYPNPAKPGSNVTILFNTTGTFGWRLVNTHGMEILKQEPKPVTKNQSQTFLLPANLSSGQYYIQVINADKMPLQTYKLMVVR